MSLRPSGVVSVCLHIVLDGTAAAPYETAWCRSNRESIQNQRSERHRSQPSVLLRVLGRMPGHDRMGGRCRTNGAPLARLFCFHAFMACTARSRSCCRESASSRGCSVTWRGLRPFCGSARPATVAPWLPLTNRSYGVRRIAPHLTISTTMRVRPRVVVDDEQSALR